MYPCRCLALVLLVTGDYGAELARSLSLSVAGSSRRIQSRTRVFGTQSNSPIAPA
ncbi:hypothetical protein PR003_g10585 [Phytophthora rubi]|uniref:Uncharacterized protein n=1 Tax=Phytophthora rubi TaxID=129364 RepID=A0A6A4FD41_9STRA|nr:hypothetical protein PR003_g10585 [Phytophthora rubi]